MLPVNFLPVAKGSSLHYIGISVMENLSDFEGRRKGEGFSSLTVGGELLGTVLQ